MLPSWPRTPPTRSRPPADPTGQSPGSIFYVEDPDIQGLLDKAGSLGAKTVTPVTEIPDMVTFALFADPFGNVIGLVKGDETVKVSGGDNPAVDWFEVFCSEPQRAWEFYRALFGWKIEGSESEGLVHGQVDTGGAGPVAASRARPTASRA